MEISKIIENGEILSPEQLAKVSGGLGAQTNTNNTTQSCVCNGTGDNNNTGKVCQCNDNLESSGPNDDKANTNP